MRVNLRPRNNRSTCPYCKTDIYNIDDWVYCECLFLNAHRECLRELSNCGCHTHTRPISVSLKPKPIIQKAKLVQRPEPVEIIRHKEPMGETSKMLLTVAALVLGIPIGCFGLFVIFLLLLFS